MPDDERRLEHALTLAYRYLNRRERTGAEVRRHLEQKGLDAASCDRAVDFLIQAGYIDDAKFAQLFVQDKRELEEWGSERIGHGLLARGIDRELIHEALVGREVEGTAELERALTLLSRRFPSPPQERRERDRALGLLIRKGYDPELALDALAAYAKAGRPEPDHATSVRIASAGPRYYDPCSERMAHGPEKDQQIDDL